MNTFPQLSHHPQSSFVSTFYSCELLGSCDTSVSINSINTFHFQANVKANDLLYITWQYMNMLVSIHVVGEVTCQLPEQPDLGPQLQLHLGKKPHTHIEVCVMDWNVIS